MPTRKKEKEGKKKKKESGTRMQWFWSKIIMFEVMLPSAVFQCFCPNTGILMTAATHVCCMEAEKLCQYNSKRTLRPTFYL